jgi:hypothetical protein
MDCTGPWQGGDYGSERVCVYAYVCVRMCVRVCVRACMCVWCNVWVFALHKITVRVLSGTIAGSLQAWEKQATRGTIQPSSAVNANTQKI